MYGAPTNWIVEYQSKEPGERIVAISHATHSGVLLSWWVAGLIRLVYWAIVLYYTADTHDKKEEFWYLVPILGFFFYLATLAQNFFPIYLSRSKFSKTTKIAIRKNSVFLNGTWIQVEKLSFSVGEFHKERRKKDLDTMVAQGRTSFCRKHRLSFKKVIMFYNGHSFCDVINVENDDMATKVVLVLMHTYDTLKFGKEAQVSHDPDTVGNRIILE